MEQSRAKKKRSAGPSKADKVTGKRKHEEEDKDATKKKRIATFGHDHKNGPRLEHEVYVRKDTFRRAGYVERCLKLLGSVKRVEIHGMGAAVLMACNVALAVEERCNVKLEKVCETYSVNVIDQYEHHEFDSSRMVPGIKVSLKIV